MSNEDRVIKAYKLTKEGSSSQLVDNDMDVLLPYIMNETYAGDKYTIEIVEMPWDEYEKLADSSDFAGF